MLDNVLMHSSVFLLIFIRCFTMLLTLPLFSMRVVSVFLKRLGLRVDKENEPLLQGFLAMYSNPVVNKMKYKNES